MSTVRKSLVLSLGQNYVSVAIQFVVSVIMARLLTPSEMGVFSVAMVIIGFAHTLRDFGVSSYVIQEKDLTTDKIRAAFALTLITAWTMALVILLASDFAASFYKEPGIRSVMRILALNFALIPFGTISVAYMHREMNFTHPAMIRVLSNLVGAITTLALAYQGFSYLSMAWGSVASTACNVALAQVWRPKNLPFFPGIKEMGSAFKFGLLSNTAMLLIDAMKGVPDMVIGRLSGMAMVGYFGRATGLGAMFEKLMMSSLWSVAVPHFALQSRKGIELKEEFLHSSRYVTAVAWPFFFNLSLLAHPVVNALYGNQWEPSVPLVRLLCISSLITAPFLLWGSMLTAIGQMRQNVILLAVHTPIIIILVFITTPYGLSAIGIGYVIVSIVDNVMSLIQCKITINVTAKELIKSLPRSLGVTIVSAIVPSIMLTITLFFPIGTWIQLFLGGTGALLGWLIGLFLFQHPLRKELTMIMKKMGLV